MPADDILEGQIADVDTHGFGTITVSGGKIAYFQVSQIKGASPRQSKKALKGRFVRFKAAPMEENLLRVRGPIELGAANIDALRAADMDAALKTG